VIADSVFSTERANALLTIDHLPAKQRRTVAMKVTPLVMLSPDCCSILTVKESFHEH
jgi:hypothetical protein